MKKRNTPEYITKDGSLIRELLHPAIHNDVTKQSLAQATIQPGETTLRHSHQKTEEIYYVLQGEGKMHLGDESFDVCVGDSVVIPPKYLHSITNIGTVELIILCCCSPPYQHSDTEIMNE